MSETNIQRPRRVSIVDVARRAGVSTASASASKVLRNAYGASGSMRGRTFTNGVVVSDLRTRSSAS